MSRLGFKDRLLLLDVLAVLLGISSWVSINGLWVELPLLVARLPESWDLASYLSITVQIANLGPLAYSFVRWISKGRVTEKFCIYGLLVLGTVSAFLMSSFWPKVTVVFGQEHSMALLILVFFLSLVDCTSSVLYFPFMALFRATYLNSFMIGEGFSGLIPAIGSLAQGVGGNAYCQNVTYYNETTGEYEHVMKKIVPEPRFSVDVFFYLLGGMMLVSGLAFFLMNNLPQVKSEYASNHPTIINSAEAASNSDVSSSSGLSEEEGGGRQRVLEEEDEEPLSKQDLYILLVIQGLVCFLMNGAMPSIQPYSCLPYGNLVFHLSVTLHAMTSPLLAFAAFFIPCKSVKVIKLLFLLALVFVGVIMATAVSSPNMLAGQNFGGFLTVFSWVTYGSLLSYVKVSIARKCRQVSSQALFWYGVFNQIGSAVGAFVMFFLTTNNVFKKYELQC